MSDLHTSITKAFEYLSNHSVEIPPDLMITARLKGISLKAGTPEGGMTEIKARYNKEIVQALTTYFEGGSTATPKNQFRGAMVEGFNSAFDTGWNDGGGVAPIEADALEWLRTQVNAEIGHIDGVFQQAKELRQEADFDFFPWVTARADGFGGALDGIYNAARMLAKKNRALTWRLGNTEKHCNKCKELNGQTHKASWYIRRNYIPGKPGADMDCGGYHCDCRLEDKEGNVIREIVPGTSYRDAENLIANQKIETAGIYDKNGNLLFSKDGNHNSVIFTNDEVKQMKGNLLTHNHPLGTSFSKDDINMFNKAKLGEIRAVTNEYVFILKRDGSVSFSNQAIMNQYQEAFSEIGSRAWLYDTPQEITHATMEKFIEKLGYKSGVTYKRERR